MDSIQLSGMENCTNWPSSARTDVANSVAKVENQRGLQMQRDWGRSNSSSNINLQLTIHSSSELHSTRDVEKPWLNERFHTLHACPLETMIHTSILMPAIATNSSLPSSYPKWRRYLMLKKKHCVQSVCLQLGLACMKNGRLPRVRPFVGPEPRGHSFASSAEQNRC